MTLVLENVSKLYGDTVALDRTSFTLNCGIYGLLGPNGAGKTTLMRIFPSPFTRTSTTEHTVLRVQNPCSSGIGCAARTTACERGKMDKLYERSTQPL